LIRGSRAPFQLPVPVKNTVDMVVGRLVEIDLAAGFRTPQDVAQIGEQIIACVSRLRSGIKQAVIFSDWRACQLVAPETAQEMISTFTKVNFGIERSALLHNTDQPTSVLQMTRVLREGRHPDRRVFTNPNDVITFLSERLQPAEIERLKTIVAKHQSR
jgi:hypothetical protein